MRYYSKTQAPREAKRRKEKDETIRTCEYSKWDIREYSQKINPLNGFIFLYFHIHDR
jgi:hypothetical protein